MGITPTTDIQDGTRKNVKRKADRKHERARDRTELTEEQSEMKRRLLTASHASTAGDITDAIVIKEGNVFLVASPAAGIPLQKGHGLGVYTSDCRYLRGYEVKVAGCCPMPLISTTHSGSEALFQLTNGEPLTCGKVKLDKHELAVKWIRRITDQGLEDEIHLSHHGKEDVELPVEIQFLAEFEDIFVVRGLLEPLNQNRTEVDHNSRSMTFSRLGIDGATRRARISFSSKAKVDEESRAHFLFHLKPRKPLVLKVEIQLEEEGKPDRLERETNGEATRHCYSSQTLKNRERLSERKWLQEESRVFSDSLLLNRASDRAFRDLRMLRSRVGEGDFFSAGIPWFGTLFGRDSLITAMQMLAFDTDIAQETLELLACFQGERLDVWNDEAPGKILHELRRGEFASSGKVPYSPYYGTVDATLLFLILLGQHSEWTGDITLFERLKDNVERALGWIEKTVAENPRGYLQYTSPDFVKKGRVNQGWKDSGNAMVTHQGEMASSPISLCEVQAYTWLALHSIANLYLRSGDQERSERLQTWAEDLRQRFEKDFWSDDLRNYEMALQGKELTPLKVQTSNPGHTLWAGIVRPDRAEKVADRLMKPDLFSGWGIRTLSTEEKAYNPVSYHLGTVWPHENALIAAGFRKYGLDQHARTLYMSLLHSVTYFENHRFPEAFAGYSREEYAAPVRYPVACHPQAWAAGSLPYMITTMLGLIPMGFDGVLRIVRPMLPEFVDRLDIRRISVGKGWVSLRFYRHEDTVAVEVLDRGGELRVQIEPPSTKEH